MTCKSCQAGHRLVVYEVYDTDRCPVCEAIERLDKQLLAADVQAELRIECLEAQLAEAQTRINKLTNEKVSNLKEHWNGGAS